MKDVEAVTGMSGRHLARLFEDGTLPRLRPRRYNLAAVVPALLRYYRDGREASTDMAQAKLRLIEAQRRQTELATRQKEREVIPLADVQRTFDAAMVLVAGQLDGLAGRMAGELAAISEPSKVRARLFDETRRIRAALAESLEAIGNDASGRKHPEAASDPHG